MILVLVKLYPNSINLSFNNFLERKNNKLYNFIYLHKFIKHR